MLSKFKMSLAALAVAAPLLGASPVMAARIVGGTTEVTLTSAPALAGLGLSFTTFGTATASTNAAGLPVASFRITGGTQDDSTGNLLVEHEGSGLLFSSGENTLSIGNFVIDTAAGVVSALAIFPNVPIFTIGSDLSLTLTDQGAGAFANVFGTNGLSGTVIGNAQVNFQTGPAAAVVPEPSTWAMMLLGFGAVAVARRRASARVAHAA